MSVVSAEQIRMMQASEEALRDAVWSRPGDERRVALGVVSDTGLYELWKADLRLLLGHLSQARSLSDKQSALRRIGTGLVHQAAFVNHLRRSSITGEHRERLLARFFQGIDYETAVLHEHRRYRLAVASRIALDRLLLLQHDVSGSELLVGYDAIYGRYFGLYCDWLALRRGAYADIVGAAMLEARRDADEWRRLTLTTRLPPAGGRLFPRRGRSRPRVAMRPPPPSRIARRH